MHPRSRSHRHFAALVALAFVSSLPAAQPAVPPPRPTPTVADFVYGSDSPRQVFDFWRAHVATPTPVVVLIHGGGWIQGDKSSYGMANIQPYLDAGISVASISYRYVQEAYAAGIRPPVKASLEDGARAVQTLRFKAREWNIDPRRVGASGGSAGACTSLWLALHDDMANPKSADPVARESTRLTCVAVNAPQTSLDPQQMRAWIPNSEYGAGAFGLRADGRWSPESFEQFLRQRDALLPGIKEYSPIEHVSADDPPIYMWFPKYEGTPTPGETQKDPTHSAVFGVKLADALRAVGVEAVLNYPAAPETRYGSMQAFMIAKLKSRPASR